MRGDSLTLEIFKKDFLDRFFPRDIVGKSGEVHQPSPNRYELSKYALSFISDPRDEMIHFVKGVSNDLPEECHSTMLHDNMNIYCLMVHERSVEEARYKRKSRYAKIPRLYDGGSSMNILKYKTDLDLRSGFQVKSLQCSNVLP